MHRANLANPLQRLPTILVNSRVDASLAASHAYDRLGEVVQVFGLAQPLVTRNDNDRRLIAVKLLKVLPLGDGLPLWLRDLS